MKNYDIRFIFGAVILALLLDSAGQAQSLADVARQERARQVGAAQSRVYTNESVADRYWYPVEEASAGSLSGSAGDLIGPNLESFEQESVAEIRRLEDALADPAVTDEERSSLELDMTEAASVLAEIREELLWGESQPVAGGAQTFSDPRFEADAEDGWGTWDSAVESQRTTVRDLEGRVALQELVTEGFKGPNGHELGDNATRIERIRALVDLERVKRLLEEARSELERLETFDLAEQ